MSDNDQLDFVAYVEPQVATVRWYQDVLYKLWQHGLSFSRRAQKPLSWEEELRQQPEYFIAGSSQEQSQPQRSLAQWLDEAAATGSATLYAYDKDLEMRLSLQPGGSETLKRSGMIGISYYRADLNPEEVPTGALLPSYLQVWFAHLHWAELCCVLFNPLYALSYQQGDILPLEVLKRDSGDDRPVEDPSLRMYEKARKALSIVAPPLERVWLQYFSPHLLTEEEERSLLRQPYQFSEYLPGGGLLVVPREEPFHYGFGLAHDFWNQMREAAEQEEDTEKVDRLMEYTNMLFDVYRRLLRQK